MVHSRSKVNQITVFKFSGFVFVYRIGKKMEIVEDISIEIKRGETLGLVGESGCGKSVTSMSILQRGRFNLKVMVLLVIVGVIP